jgi:methionyl-tRNA formyltransferase
VLEGLNSVHPVSWVVTGEDKPSGRGQKLQFSPLKITAEKLDIPVLQFHRVSKDGLLPISELNPDLIITASFGQILSQQFLDIAKHGVLNVHASLLPKFRGASPIQTAILKGEKETGITIMRTVKELDAGDILLSKSLEISPEDTAGTLSEKLAILGAQCITEAVSLVSGGRAVFTPQDSKSATFCHTLDKSEAGLDFSLSVEEIVNAVRAFNPAPMAYTTIASKTIKVLKAEKAEGGCPEVNSEPHILSTSPKQGLIVACKGGAVRLSIVQPEGKKLMPDTAFLNGIRNILS